MTHAPFVVWRNEYLVGQSELDSHHRRMFEIINALYDAILDHATRDHLEALFRQARDYAQMHFRAEEELLRAVHYEGLTEQERAHHGYMRQLDNLLSEAALTEEMPARDLLQFLRKWWLHHILEMDREYSGHVSDPK